MQETTGHTKSKKTYPQNWKAYNAAQTHEKAHFLKFLNELCSDLPELPQNNGRPRMPTSDALFAICFKVYSNLSARRFMSDLRNAWEDGYISRLPHYNTLYNILDDERVTELLCGMIIATSRPLAIVETSFAADSSGFTASRYGRWVQHKYGHRRQKDWVKAHIMCGVKTNIVTAVDIGDKNAADAPMLPGLVKITADNFNMSEVSADKAYGSFRNYDVIAEAGATPYIPFKENRRGSKLLTHIKSELWGSKIRDEKKTKNVLWNKMYHLFKFHEAEFMRHYHQRSNVESVFSMVKTKFGGDVRSKTDIAMKNEVLAKFVCHNICVLGHEMRELGVDICLKSGGDLGVFGQSRLIPRNKHLSTGSQQKVLTHFNN